MNGVMEGFSVCIFAYGPTGTGKTFTMMGDGSNSQRGLAPRILERIFDEIKNNESFSIDSMVTMSMV